MNFSLSNWPMMSAILVWLLGTYLAVRLYLRDRGSPLRFESIGLAVALIPFFAFLGVFVHDLGIHNQRGRPWSPWFELVFDTWIDVDKQRIFASVPMTSKKLEFEVTHTRRGRYAFVVWVPERKADLELVKNRITLKCSFYDQSDTLVAVCKTQNWIGGVWIDESRLGRRNGSTTDLGIYVVPADVPLDKKLKAVVEFDGMFDAFLEEHPDACLNIEKDSDK